MRFNRRKAPSMFEETLRRIAERKPLPYQELVAERV